MATVYAVGIGHDVPEIDLVPLDPQPFCEGVQVTREVYSANGNVHGQGAYAELVFAVLDGSQAYRDLLVKFGLNIASRTAPVTVRVRDEFYIDRVVNGTAVRPAPGGDLRWRYFPNVTILVRDIDIDVQPPATPVPETESWLAGGATGIVAAYEPIHAATLADSYVNLANPGTFDITPIVAPSLSTGWLFAEGDHLNTGIIPAEGWSMIAAFSDRGGFINDLMGSSNGTGTKFALVPGGGGNDHGYYAGGSVFLGTRLDSGIMAVAGQQGYLDGIADGGVIPGWDAPNTTPMYIGGTNSDGGHVNRFIGRVTHAYVYNSALSAAQVAAITTAIQGDL